MPPQRHNFALKYTGRSYPPAACKTCQNSLNLCMVSTAESRHHIELNPKPYTLYPI
ncbi:hypothetical protein ISS30_09945 [bacterium]|nr:hypothetical protein [bacterium]